MEDLYTGISHLPNELLLRLFSYLDDRWLFESGLVSKDWNWAACLEFFDRAVYTTEVLCDNVNATKRFTAAIKLNGYSNPALLYFHRGTCYYREEESEQSLEDLSMAVKLSEPGAERHIFTAVKCQIQSDFAGAVSEASKAIELEPNNSTAFYIRGFNKYDLQDYQGSLEDLTNCLTLHYPYKWKVYNSRGWDYRIIGEVDKALADFTTSGRLNVRYTKAFINKCTLICKKKRPPNFDDEQFVTDFLKNTRETNLGGIYFTRASIRYELKKYEESIQDYRDAIDSGFHSPHKCHIGVALAYEALDQFDKAAPEYDAVVRLKPNLASVAIESRAEAKLHIDNEGCIADCKLAIATNPKNLSFAFRYLAAYKADREDYDGAIATVTEGLKANPFNNAMLNLRAAFYTFKGDYKKAMDDYDISLRDRPDGADVWKLRGDIKFASGDVAGALEDYHKSRITCEDDDIGAANNCGAAHIALGEFEKALPCFLRATELTNDLPALEVEPIRMEISKNENFTRILMMQNEATTAEFMHGFLKEFFVVVDLSFEEEIERRIRGQVCEHLRRYLLSKRLSKNA